MRTRKPSGRCASTYSANRQYSYLFLGDYLASPASASYAQIVIYVTVFAVIFFVFSIVRIALLNTEIGTLGAAGIRTQQRVSDWEATNPLDTSSPESFAASKATMPPEIQEAETEYLWLWNERDSKKESRTLWFGGAVLALIVGVLAIFVHF
jgi:hypothetical protein